MSDATMEMKNEVSKLSFFQKFSYGIGEFACSLVWGLVSSYLLFFYTDVYGLAGGVIALLMLVARVWDCFVDPLIGLITERTKSKYGRFRPYILYGAVSLGLFNILTFYTPSYGPTGKAIYATLTYLLLGTFHSIVNVPYGALATVMTRDTNERTSLNSFRALFSQVAGVVTGASVMPLIQFLGKGNTQNGYFYTSIVLTVIGVPMLLLTFFNSKEIVEPTKHEKPTIKESFIAVGQNKPLLLMLSTMAISLLAIFGRIGVIVYYAIYVIGRPDLIAILFTLLSIGGIFGALIVGFIAKNFEKKTLLFAGNILSGICFIIMFLTPVTNISLILTLQFIGSISLGFQALTFSMVGDCIDDYQVKSGKRSDGAIYSFFSLTTKVVNAIVGSISALVLSAIGYVANQPQTPEVVHYLNMLINLTPGIIFIVAIFPMFFYKIDKKTAMENTAILLERQNKI